jgi:hypothetical protein
MGLAHAQRGEVDKRRPGRKRSVPGKCCRCAAAPRVVVIVIGACARWAQASACLQNPPMHRPPPVQGCAKLRAPHCGRPLRLHVCSAEWGRHIP